MGNGRIFFSLAWMVAFLFCVTERSKAHYHEADIILSGLENPWAVVPANDGTLFITETQGQILVMSPDGSVIHVNNLPRIEDIGQGGLLDLAFHPNFDVNRWLYLAYTVVEQDVFRVQVARFTIQDYKLSSYHPIIDGPSGRDGAHFGCRLLFGLDQKLYITMGERHQPLKAQSLNHLHGKILRLNDDGTIPRDNPFVAQRKMRGEIFSYGHRNPQGLDIHPTSGVLYATEHGPSGYDAPHGGDEINIIKRGKNYGWPVIHHSQRHSDMVTPIVEYTPAEAPSGAAFYKGSRYPKWKHDFFFAALRGRALHRIKFAGPRVVEKDILLDGMYGRLRDVASGKDGYLYILTTSGELLRMKTK